MAKKAGNRTIAAPSGGAGGTGLRPLKTGQPTLINTPQTQGAPRGYKFPGGKINWQKDWDNR